MEILIEYYSCDAIKQFLSGVNQMLAIRHRIARQNKWEMKTEVMWYSAFRKAVLRQKEGEKNFKYMLNKGKNIIGLPSLLSKTLGSHHILNSLQSIVI